MSSIPTPDPGPRSSLDDVDLDTILELVSDDVETPDLEDEGHEALSEEQDWSQWTAAEQRGPGLKRNRRRRAPVRPTAQASR